MMNEILLVTESLKSKFKCENCKATCDIPYRIKLCGHIHCHNCISSSDKCFKCSTKFVVDDIFIDNSLLTIFKSIDILATELRGNNVTQNKVNTLSSACAVLQSEENESKHILDSDPTDDRVINFNCDCMNYIEVKDEGNTAELVDKKNAVGETKLHRACKKGNEAEVETLLNTGASVNAQDYAKWTPLHEAIIIGNKKIIEWLIEKGSVVNAPGFNYDTPLHKAVFQKNIEIAQILVENGADIHSKNCDGTSPWDLADSDMKFVLNNIKCESVTLQIPFKTQEYNIFILGKITEELEINIQKFSRLIKINVMDKLNENVTHIISACTSKVVEPSFELLLAITYCIPVVTSEWVQACVTLRSLVNCKEYYVVGTEQFKCDIIHRTQIHKYKLNPKLFSGCYIFISKGCGRYLLSGTDTILESTQVKRLVTVGGGTLLKREPIPGAINPNRRPWHAMDNNSLKHCTHYVLYDPATEPVLRYNMSELKHVPYQWLFECILRYQLVVPEQLLCKQS